MNLIQSYLDYHFRPLPTHPTPIGYDVNENFTYKIIFWSIFFIAWFVIFHLGGKCLFPHWYSQLTDRKKIEFPAYAACLVHHFYAVPRAWQHLYVDYHRNALELSTVHYAELEAILAPFSFGYLIADSICYGIPDFIYNGNIDFLLHHGLSIAIVLAAMPSSGHLFRYAPNLFICDSSNIFFNIAWLLRTIPTMKGTLLVSILEILFAFFYLIARVINLPIAIWSGFSTPFVGELGIARWGLIPIIGLQWYWFGKIILGILGRLSMNSIQSDKDKNQKFTEKDNKEKE